LSRNDFDELTKIDAKMLNKWIENRQLSLIEIEAEQFDPKG
jgi:hypothetical protein